MTVHKRLLLVFIIRRNSIAPRKTKAVFFLWRIEALLRESDFSTSDPICICVICACILWNRRSRICKKKVLYFFPSQFLATLVHCPPLGHLLAAAALATFLPPARDLANCILYFPTGRRGSTSLPRLAHSPLVFPNAVVFSGNPEKHFICVVLPPVTFPMTIKRIARKRCIFFPGNSPPTCIACSARERGADGLGGRAKRLKFPRFEVSVE